MSTLSSLGTETQQPDKSTNTDVVLDNETIINAVESSDLGCLLFKAMIKIIIKYMKSSSWWLEGIWISNASSGIGTIIISNSVGWFAIKNSNSLITQYVFHSIQYTKYDEHTINAKWKKLNTPIENGTVSITIDEKNALTNNINSINITLHFPPKTETATSETTNKKQTKLQKKMQGKAKKLILLKDEIDSSPLTDHDKYMEEWVKPYKANKCLLECSPYNYSKYLFDKKLNIPIFGYGTLGDRDCDGNNSFWNKTLIHGCKGKNAYINEWKLYQHPTKHFPFADNKGNCKGYKLIGRILEWNDIYINAFKIYQIDQICGYKRCDEKSSFFKRKMVVCTVINNDESEYEMKCWLWFVDKYSLKNLEMDFDLIESGDWKERKYSKCD